MPNLTEDSSAYPATVPELEVDTVALGGPGGPMNQPAQQLANRTAFLHEVAEPAHDLAAVESFGLIL